MVTFAFPYIAFRDGEGAYCWASDWASSELFRKDHVAAIFPLGRMKKNPHTNSAVGSEEKKVTEGLRSDWGRVRQQASCSRVSFSPFRFPSTVTAIDSVWKNSLAKSFSSSTLTPSIFSISSSKV